MWLLCFAADVRTLKLLIDLLPGDLLLCIRAALTRAALNRAALTRHALPLEKQIFCRRRGGMNVPNFAML
ncbi:hypothetical protein FF011L_18490 [Roseimaritima multifibrata]|uniref:Uncharacterized protein n=1 Tax=Roseimaritima multifibrata TaxID=1930274 RepID=A0A517MDY3_9BACT|nr:hypothetical protein FF011L_18490 [Roseimaritima multifibrata]